MKYKLLAVGIEQETNIGDYIQALASSQFLPCIDGFVEREQLKSYTADECKMIMNGWYMHNTKQWPPSNRIVPFFVAMHINSQAKNELLSKDSISYLKKHEPIGCRDYYTRDLLVENGVDAYFSGCMTLTLGYKYAVEQSERNDNVYFVDPYFITKWNFNSLIKNIFYLFTHYKSISKVSEKYPEKKKGLKKKLIITTFYREYIKFFSKKTLEDAIYICQQNTDYTDLLTTNENRLKEAEHLVRQYARAALVVTSRIHCALPCLGLNTSVVYIEDAQQSEASACRLGGLRELFNILSWNKDHLEAKFQHIGLMDNANYPQNKETWKPLAKGLIEKVKRFVHDSETNS